MEGRVVMRAPFLILAAVVPVACAADVCNPRDFQGVYGFQLAGTTTISSQPQPVVSVGRLVFDGSGAVSGVSSLSFTGLSLGNPITGKYEVRENCSVSWSLQDDSGNHQHFEGTMTADARSVRFRQSDPGSGAQGTLVKAADACQDRDFQARYRYSISGKRIDVGTAQVSGSFSARGVMERRGGQLTLTVDDDSAKPATGTVQVDGDCFVHLELSFPSSSADRLEMNFRGILVDNGNGLLGMATDPGSALSLRLTAR